MVCIEVGDHGQYGYSHVGTRLRVAAGKILRRSKFSVIMAISKDRIVGYNIMDHNCKKADFVDFIRTLNLSPGTALLMDNVLLSVLACSF